jgi:hypothetical protein
MPRNQRSLNPHALNQLLVKLTDPLDLLREFSTHGNAYNEVNLATMWSRLGRAHGSSLSLIRADEGQRLHALRERTVLEALRWKARALANTTHALAKLQLRGGGWRELWDVLAAASHRKLAKFDPQNLSNTAWALATPITQHRGCSMRSRPRRASGANAAWAFATAGHAAPALFNAIAVEAAPRAGQCDSQAFFSTAWSFAVADTLSLTALLAFFCQGFGRRCEALAGSCSDENLTQLHMWWLWYTRERGQTAGLPSHELLQRGRVAFTAMEGRPSNLQRQVASTLSSLGLTPQKEVRTEEGYSLNYVVEWRGHPIAIEVDGPSHFVGREPSGATLLKRRQLRHFGWKLVSVPCWEWKELEKAPFTAKAKIPKSVRQMQ